MRTFTGYSKRDAVKVCGSMLGFVMLIGCVLLIFMRRNVASTSADPLYQRLLANFMAVQPIGMNVSPNGQFILTRIEQDDGFRLSIFDRISNQTIASSNSKNPQRSLTWSPDSQVIAYQESDGAELPLYLLEVKSGKTKRLAVPVSRQALPPLRWSPDGKDLYYVQNRHLVRIIGVRQTPCPFDFDVPATGDFALSPDGTKAATVANMDTAVLSVTKLTGGTHSIRLETNGTIGEIAWSPDGHSILATVRGEQAEYFKLLEIEVSTGQTETRAEAAGDIRNPIWLPDWGSFIYHISSNGFKSAAIGNRQNARVRALGPANGILRITHISQDGQSAFARYAGVTQPTALMEIPLSGENANNVYTVPNFSEVSYPEPRSFNLESKDGVLIPVFHWHRLNMTSPPDSVLVVVHGGFHGQAFPTHEPYIDFLLARNCDVIAVNYRGSSGYGHRFERMEGDIERAWDVLAARDYAVNVLRVSPTRVYFLGSSRGASIAAIAAAQGEEIGGLILVSWVGAVGWFEVQVNKPFGIIEVHGEMDLGMSPKEAQVSIRQFFAPGGDLRYRMKWIILKNEGHNFQRAGSWARVYWEAAKLMKLDDTGL